MSASRIPTFSPCAANPSARLTVVVDLPTPPLPEATAITWRTEANGSGFACGLSGVSFGGAGVSGDFPLAELYATVRTLRIADGPDEVHNRTIARLEYAKANGKA